MINDLTEKYHENKPKETLQEIGMLTDNSKTLHI